MVRLLLNATKGEIQRIGGDFSHYRDLEQLSNDRLQMRMLPDRPGRHVRRLVGRVAERACRTWEPTPIRRRLLLSGRTASIWPSDVHQTGADIVLSHLWIPVLRRGCSLPTVWSSEGISPAAYYRYVNGSQWDLEDVVNLYRVAGRRVSGLLVFTERCARNVVTACPELEEKVYVINPPVLTPEYERESKPSERDGVVRLLFVGADAERKGLREALLAYAALRSSGARCRFTVVSRPPPDLVSELESASGVEFIRSAREVDVNRLMARSDVLVLPTHADTYAKVAVEAMAYGCAVVITDLDPLPEVVPDGQVGFTVPIGDGVELVRQLSVLVTNEGLLRGMQAEARRLHLRRNSPEVVRDKIERMAVEILMRSAASSRSAVTAADTQQPTGARQTDPGRSSAAKGRGRSPARWRKTNWKDAATLTMLLNATPRELHRIGGDFSYYRDLQMLSDDHLQMPILADRIGRRGRWLASRAAERACRMWEPAGVRRELLLRGRMASISSGDLRQAAPDIVLSHLWFPVLPSGTRLPTIWSSQGISPTEYYSKYVSRGQWDFEDVVDFYRTVSRRVSALLVWTERCARTVVASCPGIEERLYVIHPPVHVQGDGCEPKPSAVDGILRLLFVGVDAEEKGLREALHAYTLVHSSGLSCQFTVVSNPPPDLIARLASTPGVRFLTPAPQKDVYKLMAESDVLVLPTHADTYGKVAVEAMAFGCAVVISDLDPLPEVVPDGQVGFTVPIGDEVELVHKLQALLGNEALLRHMQAEARRLHLRRNSPKIVKKQLERMADDVLERARQRTLSFHGRAPINHR